VFQSRAGELSIWTGCGVQAQVLPLALRAAGEGQRVALVQLLKGGISQGPDHPVRLVAGFEWYRTSTARNLDSAVEQLGESEIQAVQTLWSWICMQLPQYDLVVLDGLDLAICWGVIAEAQALQVIRGRSASVSVALCVEQIPPAFAELADILSEIRSRPRPEELFPATRVAC